MTRAIPVFLALALAGCFGGKVATTTLRLSPLPPAPAAVRAPGSVALAGVDPRGVTGGLRYTYVMADRPAELRQAATIFWEEAPPTVVARAVTAALGASFTGGAPARTIRLRIDRFEEASAPPRADAVVAFTVVEQPSGATRRYCRTSPIADAGGETRARAFARALAAAVADLVQGEAGGTSPPPGC